MYDNGKMNERCTLYRASIGGFGLWLVALLLVSVMSTATAMPTTIRLRTIGTARARDSSIMPDIADTSAISAQEEGKRNVRLYGRKNAPRWYRSSLLAWRMFRCSHAFHCRYLSGYRMPISSRAGCL